MEKDELIQAAENLFSKRIIQRTSFASGQGTIFWVEPISIETVVSFENYNGLNVELELVAGFEIENEFIMSYFLLNVNSGNRLVVRSVLERKDEKAEVVTPSVESTWPVAKAYENELMREYPYLRFSSGAQHA